MARKETILNVLIASPGDVNEERDIILKVIDELNLIWSKNKNLRITPLCWEKNSYPDIGDDPQDVINKQFQDDYDIFIGVLWSRFGTPTGRANSGTEEEFDRAYAKYLRNPSSIKIMLYLKESSISFSEIDPDQISLIKNFKNKVKKNHLIFEFTQPEEFRNLLHRHLSKHLIDWGTKWGNVEGDYIDPNLGRATQEQGYFQYFNDEDGYFDIVEKTELGIKNGTESANKIRDLLEDYKKKISNNLEALNTYKAANKIADAGFLKRNVNNKAMYMDGLREGLEIELSVFEENFKINIEGIRHAAVFLLESKLISPQQLENTVNLLATYKSTFSGLLPLIENVISSISNQKRLTTKFNKAKKRLVSTLEKFHGKLIELRTATTVIENEVKEACSNTIIK